MPEGKDLQMQVRVLIYLAISLNGKTPCQGHKEMFSDNNSIVTLNRLQYLARRFVDPSDAEWTVEYLSHDVKRGSKADESNFLDPLLESFQDEPDFFNYTKACLQLRLFTLLGASFSIPTRNAVTESLKRLSITRKRVTMIPGMQNPIHIVNHLAMMVNVKPEWIINFEDLSRLNSGFWATRGQTGMHWRH